MRNIYNMQVKMVKDNKLKTFFELKKFRLAMF